MQTDPDKAKTGNLIDLNDGNTCFGKPCLVMRDTPLGVQRFHLRFKKDGEWGLWSNVRTYHITNKIETVEDLGFIDDGTISDHEASENHEPEEDHGVEGEEDHGDEL